MKPSTGQDYRERLVRTLSYIQDHLDEDLDLERLASVAAFSRFHFHRIFRGLTGETVGEHVRRLRLERAARELKSTLRPVTDIALHAGFATHESFTRAFGDWFGVPPSTYRSEHMRAVEPRACHPPDYPEIPPVALQQLPPMKVVFLRHVGPYAEVGAAWGRLMTWAGMRGLLSPAMKLIGIVYDDPDVTPAEKVRYDAAVTVARPVAPEGDFGVTGIPGGRYAVATHQGPYAQLSGTYQRLFGGWLPQCGCALRDTPAFEMYLNSPRNTRPEDLLTAIHIPLED